MKGDLIIKDVDLEQLEEDSSLLNSVRNFFIDMKSNELTEGESVAIVRILGMLKTWAEELTTELLLNAVENRTEVKAAVLYVLKAQRKRLGK